MDTGFPSFSFIIRIVCELFNLTKVHIELDWIVLDDYQQLLPPMHPRERRTKEDLYK